LANAFRENGVEFEQVNYLIDELTEDKLRKLLKKANLEPSQVLRKREKLYKELNLAEETDSDKLIKLIVENPGLLERPIVEVGNKAVLARPIEKALELISEKR
jgi:arsenate reductase